MLSCCGGHQVHRLAGRRWWAGVHFSVSDPSTLFALSRSTAHRDCSFPLPWFTVTDVAAPGSALFASAGSATSKLGVRKKNVSRHIAARPARIGKNAQSESSPPVRERFPWSEGGTSVECVSVFMPRKLALPPKVPTSCLNVALTQRPLCRRSEGFPLRR